MKDNTTTLVIRSAKLDCKNPDPWFLIDSATDQLKRVELSPTFAKALINDLYYKLFNKFIDQD